MGKLRHIALSANDIEATAGFYEKAFGMARVGQLDYVITLSDGVVSLAIVDARRCNGRKGLDHIGFLVDDMDAAAARLEAGGSMHCGQIAKKNANSNIERKYRDPDGLVFDIATPEHARPVWGIPA
jgi:catechol 2,3-dioxygenase-like lactoylglutathione lyase family enzyme